MSETNNNGKEGQIEIGALWKKQGLTQKFLSGTIKRSAIPEGNEDIQIVVFSNKFKKAENHPDLRIYLSKPKAAAPVTAPAKKSTSVAKAAPSPEPIEEANGDDDNII